MRALGVRASGFTVGVLGLRPRVELIPSYRYKETTFLAACDDTSSTVLPAKWGFPKIRGTLLKGLHWGYIGMMQKKMDTTT